MCETPPRVALVPTWCEATAWRTALGPSACRAHAVCLLGGGWDCGILACALLSDVSVVRDVSVLSPFWPSVPGPGRGSARGTCQGPVSRGRQGRTNAGSHLSRPPRPCSPQDYELEAEKLRSLLDLENGRSSHVSKRARLQAPAAKVKEEVSPAPAESRPHTQGKPGRQPSWVLAGLVEDKELVLGRRHR